MIRLYQFPLTGGWSLWISHRFHIYYWPDARPRFRVVRFH